jgi:transposase
MSIPALLPAGDGIHIECITSQADAIGIHLVTKAASAPCSLCGHPSSRVHSRYQRTLSDLPWNRVAVQIKIKVRKFFCDQPLCSRGIFTEPLPDLAARYARKTIRLHHALYLLGYALGGEAGARLAVDLGLLVSPNTLLRRLRQVGASTAPAETAVRVLGVDDWAFRKGRRYGTILVDLERRRLVDLLPDATAESLTTWLKEHPGVEILSRDRAGVYAEGARQGAPNAVQVADRWHLLKNLSETLERVLDQNRGVLQQAAPALQHPVPVAWPPTKGKMAEQESRQRRQKRFERYEQVLQLHQQGVGQREIARQVQVARATVAHYIRAATFPERASRAPTPTSLDPFKAYLHRRWQEGCRNACQLARELKEQGYTGVASWVCRYITCLRQAETKAPPAKPPATRQVAAWMLCRTQDLEVKQQAFLTALWQHSPLLQNAYDLAQQFATMIRTRNKEALPAWMQAVGHSGNTVLARFATSLKQDLAAVEAGLSLEWSNGQVRHEVAPFQYR